jgi:hypothetical protein
MEGVMKICRVDGNGVCLNCDKERVLQDHNYDICRKDAEIQLDLLDALLKTNLTYEQECVITEF